MYWRTRRSDHNYYYFEDAHFRVKSVIPCHCQCNADIAVGVIYKQTDSGECQWDLGGMPLSNYPLLLRRVLDILLDRFLPVFGTGNTSKGWNSQVCPRAIGGINTCHKMRHSLSLPTVTYICIGERPHFHHGPTTSFLHSQPIQTPPSGPVIIQSRL